MRGTIAPELIAGVAFGVEQLYDSGDVLELPSRCFQNGTAFLRDRESGSALEGREYMYRSHHNFVKHRCFVQTHSTITLPSDKKVEYVSQVWDVDARGTGLSLAPELVDSSCTSSDRTDEPVASISRHSI